MLKILIVDDEVATREGIVKRVDWKGLGVDRVDEAVDGLHGLEKAREIRPDIIMSDVKMPGMSGIEFITEVRKILPQCKVIFLSGYSDKEYLKAAIRLGAVSYVEKPIDLDELTDSVRKAVYLHTVNEDNSDSQFRKNKFINQLITGDSLVYEEARARLQPTAGDRLAALVITDDRPWDNEGKIITGLERILFGRRHICGAIGTRTVAITVYSDSEDYHESVRALFDKLKAFYAVNSRQFCAAGAPVRRIEDLHVSYDSAVGALSRLFFVGYGHVVFHEESNPSRISPADFSEQEFIRLVSEADTDGVAEFIENICRLALIFGGVKENEIKDLFIKYYFALSREAERRGTYIRHDAEHDSFFWRTIPEAETLDELRQTFLARVRKIVDGFQNAKSGHRSIANAAMYIHKHYESPDLTIKDIAEHVFLTPTYLSALFKKVKGQTVGEYIAWYRCKKSKELLLDTCEKLQDIAQRVGYRNANYFTKAFKKQCGVTPSKFRENNIP